MLGGTPDCSGRSFAYNINFPCRNKAKLFMGGLRSSFRRAVRQAAIRLGAVCRMWSLRIVRPSASPGAFSISAKLRYSVNAFVSSVLVVSIRWITEFSSVLSKGSDVFGPRRSGLFKLCRSYGHSSRRWNDLTGRVPYRNSTHFNTHMPRIPWLVARRPGT